MGILRQTPSPQTEDESVGEPSRLQHQPHQYEKGSDAEIQVFWRDLEFHQNMRVKSKNDMALIGRSPMKVQFTQEWALLPGKGYQGLAQQLRAKQ
ncbi:hypothetical protein PybrP1_000787 [[Pythium] brassicae (nom. inval.)]|nr:hypothetical protein PybrP1_000787 [[Pythium] brassicae (nom. inval.)]